MLLARELDKKPLAIESGRLERVPEENKDAAVAIALPASIDLVALDPARCPVERHFQPGIRGNT
jgi:hypothetical protein